MHNGENITIYVFFIFDHDYMCMYIYRDLFNLAIVFSFPFCSEYMHTWAYDYSVESGGMELDG